MSLIDANHTKALYLDLELTCWDGLPPVGVRAEIIEIGAVEMDLDSLTILKEAAYLVRPRHLDISKRCSDITGVSREDLRGAPPFNNVLDLLIQEFTPSRKLCCVWGDDADLLSAACQSFGMRSPLRNVVDLGQLFWRLFALRQRPSLKSATEILGLQFNGVAHTALADAKNTALIHAEILRRVRSQSRPAVIVESPPEAERSTILAEKLKPLLKGVRLPNQRPSEC